MPSSRVGVLSSCCAVAARYGHASACVERSGVLCASRRQVVRSGGLYAVATAAAYAAASRLQSALWAFGAALWRHTTLLVRYRPAAQHFYALGNRFLLASVLQAASFAPSREI